MIDLLNRKNGTTEAIKALQELKINQDAVYKFLQLTQGVVVGYV